MIRVLRGDGRRVAGARPCRIGRNRHRGLRSVHSHVGTAAHSRLRSRRGAHVFDPAGIADRRHLQRIVAVQADGRIYLTRKIQHIRVRSSGISQSAHIGGDGESVQGAVLTVHDLVKDQGHRDGIAREIGPSRHGRHAQQPGFRPVAHNGIAGQPVQVPSVLAGAIGPEIDVRGLVRGQRDILAAIVGRDAAGNPVGTIAVLTAAAAGRRERVLPGSIPLPLQERTRPELPGNAGHRICAPSFVVIPVLHRLGADISVLIAVFILIDPHLIPVVPVPGRGAYVFPFPVCIIIR